jgi:hypothetical protein
LVVAVYAMLAMTLSGQWGAVIVIGVRLAARH